MTLARTRAEFIALHEHELGGLLLDSVTAGRSGAELSIWIRRAQDKIRERLGRAYDDLLPKELPKPANGTVPSRSITPPNGATKV